MLIRRFYHWLFFCCCFFFSLLRSRHKIIIVLEGKGEQGRERCNKKIEKKKKFQRSKKWHHAMMGVVCVPEACAVYTRVYTEEEKKKRKKKKTAKIVKAKVWSSDSSAISQSKVLRIRVCDSFFYFFYFNLSHFCSFSLSFFF